MATFKAFSNILPDPANPITDAGDTSAAGTPGPGFSALGMKSITDSQMSRTNSGRGVGRDTGKQYYEFTISYNPMFRDQFDPINTFLEGRNPRKDAFYVILPQLAKPKDATYNGLTTTVIPKAYDPGESVITVKNTAGVIVGKLRPGDVFNINDTDDYNHQKIYKVSAVETTAYYQEGTAAVGLDELRLHISPPLQREVSANAKLVLVNPKFRVVSTSDVSEYQLSTDGLYSFSLNVEEMQP